MNANQALARPVRHSLGAEELVELGRAVPMYRYAHTPFLANRPQMGRSELFQAAPAAPVPVNLLQPAGRDLFLGQIPAPVAAAGQSIKKTLAIGIPVAGAAAVLLALMR